jgi:zinc-finger of transposase IS204/IS1001/IS1096/IS1165
VVSNTTKLLGLAGVQVTGVEVGDDGVPRVALATNDENARRCPSCGFASRSVHPNATTHPRDLAVAGRKTALTWHKRRWQCLEASCARKTFTEQIEQVPADARVTGRLRDELGADVGNMGRTVTEVIPTTCFGWIGHRWVSRTPATWNAGPLVEGFWLRRIRWLERLRVFSCALTLDVDREAVWYVARLPVVRRAPPTRNAPRNEGVDPVRAGSFRSGVAARPVRCRAARAGVWPLAHHRVPLPGRGPRGSFGPGP